jgi:hypothetical protein
MTNKRLLNAVAIAMVVTCVAATLRFATPADIDAQEHEAFGAAMTTDGEAEAEGRAAYEWTFLHDPATGKIPRNVRYRELQFAANLPNDGSGNFVAGRTTGALAWQSRGPWNVGGRTRALAIDVSNPNVLIAGTASGGMWRSTDAGATWTRTNLANKCQSVTCVAQDTRAGRTNTWYFGSGEAYGASASGSGAYYLGNGIYKSTDGGVSWSVLPSTNTGALGSYDIWSDLIWNIVTDKADMSRDVVYAAAASGIYRTTDGGSTWALVKGGDSYFTDVAITSTGVVYASLSSDGSQKGLFRSTDGVTYTDITPDSFPLVYNRIKIGISPSHEEQVYFLGNTPGYGQPDTAYTGGQVEWNSLWRYTYKSGDGSDTGGVWENLSNNLPTSGGPFDKFTSQGSYNLVVKVKPDDTSVVFIGGTNLYRSTSGFRDATHTTFMGGYKEGATLPIVKLYANHHPDQHELVFSAADPTKMISGNDGGIFRTDNNMAASVSWTSLNNGYVTSMFYTCAIDHATTNDVIIGGAQDNGSWYTNSASGTVPWVTPRGGDGSYCAIADNGAAYYFSIQNGKMMRAKLNSAGGVDSFARIDPIGGRRYQFINPYIIDPNDNNIMYLSAGGRVWRNNNLSGIPYAGNWDSISTNWTPIPDSMPASLVISALAVSKYPANKLFLGTNTRRLFRMDNANSGLPTKVDIGPSSFSGLFPNGNISCVAVDPTDADKILVVFSNYNVYSLFYTENGGTNWRRVAGNLEATTTGAGDGPSCRWATIMPVTGGTVYLVGTSVGLFATTELRGDSTTWVQQGVNTIGNAVITMIDWRATDGLVVVATHSQGIFSTRITHVADVNRIVTYRNSYQTDFGVVAYPNPTFGATTLRVALLAACPASIHVIDAAGREAIPPVFCTLAAGNNEVPINLTGLPHGTYQCIVSTQKGKGNTMITVL